MSDSGARGAIGSASAQLCVERGATVLGTYRSLENIQDLKGVQPILLDDSDHPLHEGLVQAGLHMKINVLIDTAGYEAPFNDAIASMAAHCNGRVVVMAAHRPDGRFNLDLRTLYSRGLTMKGLSSGSTGPKENAAILSQIAAKFDHATYVPGMVDDVEFDASAVQQAMSQVWTRSINRAVVIVP